MLHEQLVTCPYCGEAFTAFIDLSQGNYCTVEDCYVCCRPIELLVESDGQTLLRLQLSTDQETPF